MKRLAILIVSLFMCAGLFAAAPSISEGNLTDFNYIIKLAEKMDAETVYDDDFCYYAVNKKDGKAVLHFAEIYPAGKIIYAFAFNGEKFVSRVIYYDKNGTDSMNPYMRENQNDVTTNQNSSYYLSADAMVIDTGLLAFKRAEYVSRYPKIEASLPKYAKQRNKEIFAVGFPDTAEKAQKIVDILKKYNK